MRERKEEVRTPAAKERAPAPAPTPASAPARARETDGAPAAPGAEQLDPALLVRLQQGAGNAAVSRLVSARGGAHPAEEATHAAPAQQEQPAAVAPAPPALARRVLQRFGLGDVWGGIKSAAGAVGGAIRKGAEWAGEHLLGPLRGMASKAGSMVSAGASRVGAAIRGANANWTDILIPSHLAFRVATNLRRDTFARAIAAERAEQAAAVAAGRPHGPTGNIELSLLQRADSAAQTLEDAGESYFGVQKELVEGAVLGDFKENPSTLNTIGQIAIGFVPYAGQVADVRDLVAGIKKLHESGWKDPWEWFNVVLIGIGFIPGIGDLIKAGGRAMKPLIRKGIAWVGRNAKRIWRGIAGVGPKLLRGARAFGRRLLSGGRRLFGRLRTGAANLGRRLRQGVGRAVGRARALVGRVGRGISSLASRIGAGVRGLVSRGQGLLGRIGRAIASAARGIFSRISSAAQRVGSVVRGALTRVRAFASRVRQGVTTMVRRAATFARRVVQAAIQRGRALVTRFAQRARDLYTRAKQRALDLARRARQRIIDMVRKGVDWIKERVIRRIKEFVRTARTRVMNYLRSRWNHLLEKLGLRKSPLDLAAQEALGGHSLKRHGPNLSMDEMRQRVMGTHPSMPQSRTAMKFSDAATHQDAVEQAFKRNQKEIEEHFAKGGGYREWTIDYGSKTGVGFTNTGTRSSPVVKEVSSSKVTISLNVNPSPPPAYYLVSAFPAYP